MSKISLKFHPLLNDNNEMVIEKTYKGKKSKYLEGVSSGLKEDAHKEKVSEKCINSFMEQSKSEDILLFPDVHGIKQSEDIAILENADILNNGDWYTSYRLYDEDDIDDILKLSKINTLWKQCKGLPPYKKKKQMGFSIEGIIPEDGIIKSAKGETILDNILLDGVILVPRPAYETSIANGVYKALGVISPWVAKKTENLAKSTFSQILNEKKAESKFWDTKYELNSALEESIDNIMSDNKDMKKERLNIVFHEYTTAMVNLLLESQEIFSKDELNEEIKKSMIASRRKDIYDGLILCVKDLIGYYKRRKSSEKTS